MSEPKRLYRSVQSRVISGVCGGIAEYLNIDPVIVRALWILFTFMGGMGVLMYFIAMIIIPVDSSGQKPEKKSSGSSKEIWGILLIIIGLIILGGRWALSCLLPWHWDVGWEIIGPILLIAFGFALMFGRKDSIQESPRPQNVDNTAPPPADNAVPASEPKKLYRITQGRMLFGIAGGMAEYFNVDISLSRILWAAAIIFSGGAAFVLYLIMYFIVPEKSQVK